MRRYRTLAAMCILGAAAVTPAFAEAPAELVQARLLAEDATLRPGATQWLAVELTMKPGWHTYWRNPGDAGQATEIAWSLPAGFAAGAIRWPVPQVFSVDIITSYGYAGTAALLAPITVPASARPGDQAEIAAEVGYLVCEKICIPGEASLKLRLPVAAAPPARDGAAEAVFAAARAALPSEPAVDARATYDAETIALELPSGLTIGERKVAFLPFDDALIEHGAPQGLVREGSQSVLTLRRGPRIGALPASFDGVLVVEDAAARRAYAISARTVGR